MRRLRGSAIFVAASLLLLAPCYWQPRIQAGDLSSHIYNAWLTRLIESGGAQGLVVTAQTTNVLFDLLLGGLFRLFGAEAAQRIAVAAAALVFIWGAFAFTSAASGRRAWNLMPSIAVLAYGWVFHMGFFNFYIALGLCFWAMAIVWPDGPAGSNRLSRARIAAACGVLATAYVAHALPVLWCLCLLAYARLMRARASRQRAYATLALVAIMLAIRVAAQALLPARWLPQQIFRISGADQAWVFDGKYFAVSIVMLCLWGMLFLRLVALRGGSPVLTGIPFQVLILSAAGVAILPGYVLIPGFLHALAFIAERMSLAVGVCVCAVLGAARPRAFERCAIAALALVFFAFLFRDERVLNAMEDRMERAVSEVPPGNRVVSLVDDPGLLSNPLTHMIDRVCLGRCYSYANYEPSTAQFRVRAVAANPFVVHTYADSWALQTGAYRVKPADAPIYALDLEPSGRFVVKNLKAGSLCRSTYWKALPDLFPGS